MYRFVTALSVLLLVPPVLAGDFDSGSDGSDGALNCESLGLADCENTCTGPAPCDVEINLRLATTASWDTPSPDPGKGVYDADEWAVVFKYTTIDIPAFVTVRFRNHLKGAPVMWLASGDVTIAGTVRLDGANGSTSPAPTYAVPGPGGFSGGMNSSGNSAGFGPGGGQILAGDGGYGTPGVGVLGGVAYGSVSIVPLIGGSGGGGNSSIGGGAGGGAILVASSGSIFLPDPAGGISAWGGSASGGGSGGGIRLVANQISGSGVLRALGIAGAGAGRIRVEAPDIQLDDIGDPPYSFEPIPGPVFPESPAPSLRVTAVDGEPVPLDPLATVLTEDVPSTADGPVTIDIEAQNVPVGLTVTVRIVQAFGANEIVVPSTPLAGTFELSTATAEFDFSQVAGRYEVQLLVELP